MVRDGTPLYFSPDFNATLESQLIYGEIFEVFEDRDGWCWGQNQTDSYVGFVPAASLTTDLPSPLRVQDALEHFAQGWSIFSFSRGVRDLPGAANGGE